MEYKRTYYITQEEFDSMDGNDLLVLSRISKDYEDKFSHIERTFSGVENCGLVNEGEGRSGYKFVASFSLKNVSKFDEARLNVEQYIENK